MEECCNTTCETGDDGNAKKALAVGAVVIIAMGMFFILSTPAGDKMGRDTAPQARAVGQTQSTQMVH